MLRAVCHCFRPLARLSLQIVLLETTMMQTDPQAILDAAMQLREADRLTLVSRLMESLPPDCITISLDDPELAAELDRRFAESDEGIDWSRLKAEG